MSECGKIVHRAKKRNVDGYILWNGYIWIFFGYNVDKNASHCICPIQMIQHKITKPVDIYTEWKRVTKKKSWNEKQWNPTRRENRFSYTFLLLVSLFVECLCVCVHLYNDTNRLHRNSFASSAAKNTQTATAHSQSILLLVSKISILSHIQTQNESDKQKSISAGWITMKPKLYNNRRGRVEHIYLYWYMYISYVERGKDDGVFFSLSLYLPVSFSMLRNFLKVNAFFSLCLDYVGCLPSPTKMSNVTPHFVAKAKVPPWIESMFW